MAQVLRVGKHRGKSFEEASEDRGYCSWILREQGLSTLLLRFRSFLVKEHGGIVIVGKYKLKFFNEVVAADAGYCDWVRSLSEPTFFEAFQEYLKDVQDGNEEDEIPEPSAKKSKQTNAPPDKCKICYDRGIDCVFVPCGHLACCLKCGIKCERLSGECPICKEHIALVTQTFAT